MPMFCFHCRDGEMGAKLRQVHRAAHLAYVAGLEENYAVGGPLKRGGEMIGSLLVIKAADEAGARAIFEQDPYYTGGVWQAIRVDEFEPLKGDWAN